VTSLEDGKSWKVNVIFFRAKISSDLAKVIDDGLYHYEEDLWHDDDDEPEPWVTINSTINRPLFKFRIQIEF
jgi:hypothetical protein